MFSLQISSTVYSAFRTDFLDSLTHGVNTEEHEKERQEEIKCSMEKMKFNKTKIKRKVRKKTKYSKKRSIKRSMMNWKS